MKQFLLTLILIFLLPFPAFGFEIYKGPKFSLGLKGYAKNLVFTSKSPTTNSHVTAALNRIRTEWDARFFKVLSAKVIWDNEFIAGDFVGTTEFNLSQAERNAPYLDMDYELVREQNFFYGQKFYRAYVRLDVEPVSLTVGRQRIGWGVMRLFTPTDLFARLSIFDIEKLERIGSTAASLVIEPGELFRMNLVYEVDPDFDRTRMGGRITKTLGHFDLSILGGKFLQDEVFGFDVSGDVKGAGLRGELLYDRSELGDDFIQFAVGIDYAFENSFYFAFEYFLNTEGSNNQIASPTLISGSQIQSIHQNFLGLQLKYDVIPIWKVMLLTVIDVGGRSLFVNPEMKLEVLSWLEVLTGAHLPVGKSGGEFTSLPNLYYFQTQAFF